MRERAIEQFESIFERASIPVLDIREVVLKRLTVVLKGTTLDDSVLRLAAYLGARFGAAPRIHWPARLDPGSVRAAAAQHQMEQADEPFASTVALIGQIALAHSQLVLLPEPEDEAARVVDVNALVSGSAPPVLFVRQPIEEPRAVFRSILHSLSGNFRQTQNFSYSFALVEDDGKLLLLHALDRDDIGSVREALHVTADLSESNEEQVLENLARSGERYLKAVVAASREKPYTVSYQLRLGNVVEIVQRELAAGAYGLLVVGQHKDGFSYISAGDYQLLGMVRDVPVLAL